MGVLKAVLAGVLVFIKTFAVCVVLQAAYAYVVGLDNYNQKSDEARMLTLFAAFFGTLIFFPRESESGENKTV